MAKIKIRKVVRQLDLDDYFGTGESEYIHVWVNPPRSIREQHNRNIQESKDVIKDLAALKEDKDATENQYKTIGERLQAVNLAMHEYWATIWSQGKDESTHWTADEVKELQSAALEDDPILWKFVTDMSIGMMNDYLNGQSKKGVRR